MAQLVWTFKDLYEDVARRFGWDPGGLTADQKAEAQRIVNVGCLNFYQRRSWNILRPNTTFTLWPTQSSTAAGAPAKDNGTSTVTAAATMFYPNMVGRTLAFTAGSSYVICTYTSGTAVKVTGDAGGEANGDTITVTADGDYYLPANFGAMLSERLIYQPAQGYPAIRRTTPGDIRQRRSLGSSSGTPRLYAVEKRAFTSTEGDRWNLMAFPAPATVKLVNFRCRLEPTKMADDGEYPLGGQIHAATIRQFCFAAVEAEKTHASGGDEHKTAEKLLLVSIDRDGEQQSQVLGPMLDPSNARPVPDDPTYRLDGGTLS